MADEMNIDQSGRHPGNRRENEIHVLAPVEIPPGLIVDDKLIYTRQMIVPKRGPFSMYKLLVEVKNDDGTWKGLTLFRDYVPAHIAETLTCTYKKYFWGSIYLTDKFAKGTFRISYNSVGPGYEVTADDIAKMLAERIVQPGLTRFDAIKGVPEALPPYNHMHDAELDLADGQDFVDALDRIGGKIEELTQAIIDHGGSGGSGGFDRLDKVENFATATPAQTITGDRSDLFVTPAGVKAAVDNKMNDYPSSLEVEGMISTGVAPLNTSITNILQVQGGHGDDIRDLKDAVAAIDQEQAYEKIVQTLDSLHTL